MKLTRYDWAQLVGMTLTMGACAPIALGLLVGDTQWFLGGLSVACLGGLLASFEDRS